MISSIRKFTAPNISSRYVLHAPSSRASYVSEQILKSHFYSTNRTSLEEKTFSKDQKKTHPETVAIWDGAVGKSVRPKEVDVWSEIEKISYVLGIILPEIRNEETLKKTSHRCFDILFQACLTQDWSLIDRFSSEILSYLTDSWGQTLLVAAANEGNETIVKRLIDREIGLAKTDPEGNTALHIAAKNGFSHLVPLLWSYYINDTNQTGKTPLHLAIEHGHPPFLRALIEKGSKNISFKEREMSFTPLSLCVRHSQKECLDYLLTRPNHRLEDDFSQLGNLLHIAIHFGQYRMIKTLLDLPKALPLLEKPDAQGRTPLALACFLGDGEVVDTLYRRMENPQLVSHNGWTLAHWAVEGRRDKILELLAYLGANLEIRDVNAKTPEALLNEDISIEAKKTKTVLVSLIEKQKTADLSPIDFSREFPEGIVFKGGGPRCLAYLGALRALKEKGALDEVRRTAGTSGGASTAAIFALDPQLQDIDSLENLDLMEFLDPIPGKEPLLKAMLAAKDKEETMFKILSGTFEVAKGAWNPLKLYHVFSQLDGICEGENLRKWVEAEIYKRTGIKNCTFGELRKEIQRGKNFLHLHIYTTRLEADPDKKIIHFSSENPEWDNIVISDAIRASMSIPGVYKPYIIREKTRLNTLIPRTDLGPCVDGGLVKNFPIDAFDLPKAQEHYSRFNRRTLGLCLKDVEKTTNKQTPSIDGILNIAKACANVYWYAEEIYLSEKKENQDRMIEIPIQGVGLCDFNLIEEQKRSLLTSGRESIEKSAFSKRKMEPEHFVHLKASNVASRLPFFTGRRTEMRKLEEAFNVSVQPSPNDTIVRLICGLGGMGKTELAQAFARNHLKDFSIVWFINSASTEKKDQSYRALAEELKIVILDKEPAEQIVRKVHARLKKHSYDKPWLLIYDNIEEPVELPQGGYVLMTSRLKDIWRNEAERIELFEFTPEESLKILSDITKKTSTYMSELARELGHFPLALNQAAHYIFETNCTIEEYLTPLKKNPVFVEMSKEVRYQHTVQNVWQITLKKLEKGHPKAYEWLTLCAYLNPDDVPQEWLTDWLQTISDKTNDWDKMNITKVLSNFSLIRLSGANYSIHRLLQQVIQLQSSREKFIEAVILIEGKHDLQGVTSWTQINKWVLQAISIKNSSLFRDLDKGPQASLLFCIGSSLQSLGRYKEALEYNKTALRISKKMRSSNNYNLAAIHNIVGESLEDLGRYRAALKHREKMIEILEKDLPSNHPDLAKAYNNIGESLGYLGRHQEALEYSQKGLEILKEVLPPNHPDLANAYNNVGLGLKLLSRYQEALEHIEKAFEIFEKVLPPNHPNLSLIYNNVGLVFILLGRHQEALKYMQKALEIKKEMLSPDHPDLALSNMNMGVTLTNLGRHQEALECNQEALRISEKVFSPDHPDLALSNMNMGLNLTNLGRHQEALAYMQKSVEISEKALSLNHPDLALSNMNIGATLTSLGRDQEALEYMEKALGIQEKAMLPNHPNLALIYNNLGITLRNVGKHEEALEYMRKFLKLFASQERSPSLELFIRNLIDTLNMQSNIQLCEDVKKEILALYAEKLGENHPLIQDLKKAGPKGWINRFFL